MNGKKRRPREQIYTEIDVLRQRVYVDIDNHARHKLDRIQEMEHKAKDTMKKYDKYKYEYLQLCLYNL